MKLEELEIYDESLARKGSRLKSYLGFENEYFKVISRAPNDPKNGVRWNCLCKSCGEYCVKLATNLQRDKSCGCQRNKNIGKALRKNLTGQRFGKLIAIKDTGKSNKIGCAIWKCKCDCGNECEVDSTNLTSGHTQSCGCINYSIGAKNIENILKKAGLTIKSEYPIKDLCINKGHPLRFDFVILDEDNNILRAIEYDGIQHYIETWGEWKTTTRLKDQQDRDQMKNNWAKEHNIPLVRIPYTERDNITLEMLLGDKYLVK